MSLALAVFSPDHSAPPSPDRVVVVGGGPATLDLLRLATIRTDDIVLFGPAIDEASLRYASRFAIERHDRPAGPADMEQAAAILVALHDVDDENAVVRVARRQGVPIHVSGRPLVSDFDLLEFLERRGSARAG